MRLWNNAATVSVTPRLSEPLATLVPVHDPGSERRRKREATARVPLRTALDSYAADYLAALGEIRRAREHRIEGFTRSATS